MRWKTRTRWLCLTLLVLSFVVGSQFNSTHATAPWQDPWHVATGAKYGFRYKDNYFFP